MRFVDRVSKRSCSQARNDGGQRFEDTNVLTYWGQRSCVQCLLHNTHRSWKNVPYDWSLLQNCIHCFLAISHQQFPCSSKVRCSGWVELPSDSSLNWMFCDPFFVPCRSVLCKFSLSSNKFCPIVADDCARFVSSRNKPHDCIRQLSMSNLGSTSICIALIVRHVNRRYNRFSFLRQIFAVKRSKKSTPTFVKAVEASNRSSGRSAITVIVSALNFLQVTCSWLFLRRFICPGSIFSAEQSVMFPFEVRLTFVSQEQFNHKMFPIGCFALKSNFASSFASSAFGSNKSCFI